MAGTKLTQKYGWHQAPPAKLHLAGTKLHQNMAGTKLTPKLTLLLPMRPGTPRHKGMVE
jgi:hypothetical protein